MDRLRKKLPLRLGEGHGDVVIGRAWWSAESFETPAGRAEQSLRARRLVRRLMTRLAQNSDDWSGSMPIARVVSRDTDGRGRRPVAIGTDGRPIRLRLSISHLPDAVAVAVSRARVGIDLVEQQPTSSGFAAFWFTEREREAIGGRPASHYWAAKEASYKALGGKNAFRPREWKISWVDATDGSCRVTRYPARAEVSPVTEVEISGAKTMSVGSTRVEFVTWQDRVVAFARPHLPVDADSTTFFKELIS